MAPRVLVLSGNGINCEDETQFAFEKAGGAADVVHINDVIADRARLQQYQILAIPGGFSFGDDTGSGKALANRIRNNLEEEMLRFVEKGLVIGICNGFQVLTNLGLVPAQGGKYTSPTVALTHNRTARYECRWVELIGKSRCVWTKGIKRMEIPVAHGEGKFYASEQALDELRRKDLVVFRYAKPDGVPANGDFPYNPNGSIDDIAAICDETGRILGMMPHPERHIDFIQNHDWPSIKEKLKREGKPIPAEGPGMQIFRNGVEYFR